MNSWQECKIFETHVQDDAWDPAYKTEVIENNLWWPLVFSSHFSNTNACG